MTIRVYVPVDGRDIRNGSVYYEVTDKNWNRSTPAQKGKIDKRAVKDLKRQGLIS